MIWDMRHKERQKGREIYPVIVVEIVDYNVGAEGAGWVERATGIVDA